MNSFLHVSPAHAQNDRVEDVKIFVSIKEDGSAHIVEERVEHNYTGTERYIVKENVSKSEITGFSVTMNDQSFENIGAWNSDRSFEDKAYENGIIETKDGYELVWGITEKGRQRYTVQYTVTNFIKQLTDSQVLYWNFFFEDVPAEQIRVEIETNKNLNEEEESIWAFGYPGDVHFDQGKIIAYNTGKMESKHHVTLLTKFQDQTFSTEDHLDMTFEELQEEAFEGSDYSIPFEISFDTLIIIIIAIVGIVLVGFAIFVLILILGFMKGRIEKDKRKRFRKKYHEEYHREPPFDGHFLHFYYITYRMGLSDFKTILTALLLKWIKEERITIEEHEGKGFFSRAKAKITILKPINGRSIEARYFSILNRVAGDKGYFYDTNLSRWANNNYKQIDWLENLVMNQSKLALLKENYITKRQRRLLFVKATEYSIIEAGEEAKKRTYKYVNYLTDFSLLNEHEAVNVHLWDDIMIWASFLNLTEEVQKQFRKLYPKYDAETIYKAATVTSVSTIAQNTDRNRRSGRSQAARSSGSGGSASIGGGGGAFGGGRSGGRR